MDRMFIFFLGAILMVANAEAGNIDPKKETPVELNEGTQLCQFPNTWISYTIMDEMEEPGKYHLRIENSDTGMSLGAIAWIFKAPSNKGDYAIIFELVGDRPHYSRVDDIIACSDKKKFKDKLREKRGKASQSPSFESAKATADPEEMSATSPTELEILKRADQLSRQHQEERVRQIEEQERREKQASLEKIQGRYESEVKSNLKGFIDIQRASEDTVRVSVQCENQDKIGNRAGCKITRVPFHVVAAGHQEVQLELDEPGCTLSLMVSLKKLTVTAQSQPVYIDLNPIELWISQKEPCEKYCQKHFYLNAAFKKSK